ncbi:exopolysaccharide biosynthesis protein [Phenylobacterium sp. J367]|uniref:exopolysaccharide biosynthesis protein n=1 Tax=Phenylobacterium sp. J367 TaxID=2898435 RepID=UPI00215151D8|nr:exopolysaccharide biosynthesis protein [Phenylobacterium sp. J367]MCR5879987.1 exopolysaccharide biosynthesis protein [Phenylobacterium sp. J367]
MAELRTRDLQEVLDDLDKAANSNGARVSVGEILDTVGKRSFGPLLLVAGLAGMTPVSAIPTVPSLIAVITLLVAVQLLLGRESVWVPRMIEKLSVRATALRKTVHASQRPVRVVDRLTRPRLAVFTKPWADKLVAAICVLLALCTPPLELLPFVAFFPSLAIFTFGLALVVRDGLLVILALAISASLIGLIVWRLLA